MKTSEGKWDRKSSRHRSLGHWGLFLFFTDCDKKKKSLGAVKQRRFFSITSIALNSQVGKHLRSLRAGILRS